MIRGAPPFSGTMASVPTPNATSAATGPDAVVDGSEQASGGRAVAWSRLALAVVVRPLLWPTAVRAMRRTAGRGWWRRAPFLPLPTGEYLGFRLVTQYGDASAQPSAHDVVNYLVWLRQWDRATA